MNVGLAAGSVLAVALVLGAVWFSTTGTSSILEGDDDPDAVSSPGESIEFTVDEGESVSAIADRLEEAGIIESALRFRVLATFTNRGEAIRSGEYAGAAGTGTRVRNCHARAKSAASPPMRFMSDR